MSSQFNKIAIVGGGPSGLALAALLEKKGGFDYVVYESSAEHVPPRGGCLDLHPGSGQRAMREAGVFDEFKKYARYGDATIHRLFDHKGNSLFEFGEGRDAPEIDRWAIRKVLLSGIPKGKIHWRKPVQKAERDESGQIVLTFTDGSTASGFKLVVGADGTFSKIRHLVCPRIFHTARFDEFLFPKITASRSRMRSRFTLAFSTSQPRSSQRTLSIPR